jgi:hypothetical protein
MIDSIDRIEPGELIIKSYQTLHGDKKRPVKTGPFLNKQNE